MGSHDPLRGSVATAAAVRIADERGAGSVTMRAVATRLGVEAMSLYNHVKNKDDILDGMIHLVIAEIEMPADVGDWREAMRLRALAAHEVFGRHPWVPVLLDSRESSGPAALRYFDWVLGTPMKAGFSVGNAARAFSVLDSCIYGFGIQEFNYSALSDASPEERAAAILQHIPAERPVPAPHGHARVRGRLRRGRRLRLRARGHPRRARPGPPRPRVAPAAPSELTAELRMTNLRTASPIWCCF